MDNNIKVLLTIELQGSKMVKGEEISYKSIVKSKYGKDKPKEIKFKHRDIICKPATQHISINTDAYNYMRSKAEVPYWENKGRWVKISNKERLESHLQRMCEHFNGISYTYQVLDD